MNVIVVRTFIVVEDLNILHNTAEIRELLEKIEDRNNN